MAGRLVVEARDERDEVIAGFSFADCQPIQGDGLDLPVRWKRPLDDLRGKAFRLEFLLEGASLSRIIHKPSK